MKQELMQQYRQIIFTPYKIRNKIINEDRLGRDIDNFRPKEQLKVLQSYMSKEDIKQKLIHKKEMMRRQALAFLNSHKSNTLNCGFFMGNKQNLYGGFNKTGLKAYYKFDSFYLPTATYSTDFSVNTGWTSTDAANFSIDTGNSELDFSVEGGLGAGDRIYYDLASVSDTAWTLRISQINFATFNTYTVLAFVISSITGGYTTSQDALGCRFTNGGDANDYFYGQYADGAAISSFSSVLSGHLSTGTDYFAEVARLSATLLKASLHTTGFNSAPIATSVNTIASTIQTVRYLKAQECNADTPTGVKGTGTVQSMAFYNSVTPVLQNVSTSPDSLGTAADGSLYGGLSIVSGKIDNAYSFDGSTGYSILGSSVSQFNFLHNASALWSINFWMKKAAGVPAALYSIIGVHADDNAHGAGLDLNISTNRRVVCFISSGAATVIDNSGAGLVTSNDTNWHMITCRFDYSLGSANFKAREDNGADTSNDKTGTTSATDAAAAYRIANNRGSFYMNGALDEMAIFNRILSDAEITALYNSGNGAEIE